MPRGLCKSTANSTPVAPSLTPMILASLGRTMTSATRWLFLGVLIGVPWLFGGTRDWTVTVMVIALFVISGAWIIGTLARRWGGDDRSRWLQPRVLILLVGGLCPVGWSLALNPESYLDPYLQHYIPLLKPLPAWPGSVDGAVSQSSMTRISALLLALLFSVWLAYRLPWRRRMIIAMAGTGVAIAVFGIAQKLSGSPLLFWEPERFSVNNFGMYRYPGNAAAYLNLTWPLCAALTIEAFKAKRAFVGRAIWLTGTIIILVGVAVNLSKGGHLVALLILLMGIMVAIRAIGRYRPRGLSWKQWLPPVIAAVFVSSSLVLILGSEEGLHRWQALLADADSQSARILIGQACLEISQDRPWFGFGAGTFSLVFPFYSHSFGNKLAGYWRYAHTDYLQTLVEWGIVGCLLWVGIFMGGICRVAIFCLSGENDIQKKKINRAHGGIEPSSEWLLDSAVLLSLLGVAIHAVFDFPLQIASIQLYVVALLGCAWRVTHMPRQPAR